MTSLVQTGYPLIEWLQSFRTPLLDLAAQGASFLGDEPFYLVVLPVLHWAVSRRAALRLALRLALGLAVALGIWAGLAGPMAPLGEGGRILRYALLGFWLTGGAPWVFMTLGWARGRTTTPPLAVRPPPR